MLLDEIKKALKSLRSARYLSYDDRLDIIQQTALEALEHPSDPIKKVADRVIHRHIYWKKRYYLVDEPSFFDSLQPEYTTEDDLIEILDAKASIETSILNEGEEE